MSLVYGLIDPVSLQWMVSIVEWTGDDTKAWKGGKSYAKHAQKTYFRDAVLWQWVVNDPRDIAASAITPSWESSGPQICTGCRLKNDHAAPNRPDGSYLCYECR